MLKGRPPKARPKPLATCEQNRDIYGFMVRPQHLERYKEHATIYKEEEEERSDRWEQFLSTINENAAPSPAVDRSLSGRSCSDGSELEDNAEAAGSAPKGRNGENGQESGKHWGQLRKSLWAVERASSLRGRGLLRSSLPGHDEESGKRGEGADGSAAANGIPEAQPDKAKGDGSGEDSEDEFCDATEGTDFLREAESPTKFSSPTESPWEEELRSLVRGGVPMALRGELWQVFVGTKTRRIRGHYYALLTLLGDGGGDSDGVGGLLDGSGTATANYMVSNSGVLEKWTNQIEKDLPRTFPGHPALDEDGRNTLRRLLTAYARHNPAVGYCQAMNFLAGLLLLLMPEENAFWTLAGIIEDNFEGYYSEKMVEAQVDQLIFDDLVREKFPKLANHLDALGVQVAWVSGPWFLSMFVNILPWESVLRVWDVLLYEGNRSMLFRTGLALMEMHAPALSATRDAGDAVAMLQAMATDTFDSSQLVLTACMGFQSVTESRLQELHIKHGPTVLAALQERSIELHLWRNSNSAITEKLPYLYNEEGSGDPLLIKKSIVVSEERHKSTPNGSVKTPQHDVGELDQSRVVNVRGPVSFEESSLTNAIGNSIPLGQNDEDHADADAKEQVAWLKNELSRELEEKKAALLRATELETAFMELVKEDNRRLLSAKVEKLEAEVGSLKQQLSDKKEQEQALVEVLVRMEQEQKIADDARRFAELDSTAQRRAAEVFQEKYEGVADALGEMEKRAVMAESMLEATLSYQALGNNSPNTSGPVRSPVMRAQDSSTSSSLTGTAAFKSYMNGTNGSNMQDYDDHSSKQGVLNRSFGLNWRDRSKARSGSLDTPFRTPAQASEHSQEPELTSQPASELSTQ